MSEVVSKRVKREIHDILEKYNNVTCTKLFPKNEYEIKIHFKNRIITFLIKKNYPFTGPIVKINQNILNNSYGINCLCCSSLSCPNIWKPAKSLLNYIYEIETNINIVENIVAIKYTYIVCKSKNIFCNEIPEYICKFIK